MAIAFICDCGGIAVFKDLKELAHYKGDCKDCFKKKTTKRTKKKT